MNFLIPDAALESFVLFELFAVSPLVVTRLVFAELLLISDFSVVPKHDEIIDKTVVARPKRFYFEPVYPLGKIYLSRTTADAETLYINSKKRLVQLATLGTEFTLPEEFKTAVIYNLAVYAAPRFAANPSQIVIDIARKGVKVLRDKALINNIPKNRIDNALLYNEQTKYRYNVNED